MSLQSRFKKPKPISAPATHTILANEQGPLLSFTLVCRSERLMFSRWDVHENEDGSWGTVYYGDYAPEFDNRRYRTKKDAKRALRRLKDFSIESDWWEFVLKSALIAFIIGVALAFQFIG